jgi:hypothetical protein
MQSSSNDVVPGSGRAGGRKRHSEVTHRAGLAMPAFCRRIAVNYVSLASWRIIVIAGRVQPALCF